MSAARRWRRANAEKLLKIRRDEATKAVLAAREKYRQTYRQIKEFGRSFSVAWRQESKSTAGADLRRAMKLVGWAQPGDSDIWFCLAVNGKSRWLIYNESTREYRDAESGEAVTIESLASGGTELGDGSREEAGGSPCGDEWREGEPAPDA